ncbi:MAG: RluA family pseudouridine synthase [Edaphocola sp.]
MMIEENEEMENINEADDLWEDDIAESGNNDETNGPAEKMRIQLTARQEPLRIDKFLMNRIEGATRNKIQNSIDEGRILVNNEQVKSNYKIRPLDEIVVYEHRSHIPTDIIPEQIPLDIIYEDEDLMVINKPAGMVVHPGSGNYTGTLVNGIAWHLNPAEDKGRIIDLPRIGLVHRIDKDTTGLLLVGKTETAMQFLAAQFKKHTVHRRYIALAWGNFEENEGTIEANIGRNLRFRKKMDAFPDGDHGKPAITHYKVLERFHYVTLLEFRLETGRTHQIRVHTRLIGHPLFNDETYGGDRIVKGTVHAKYKQFVENNFKILPRQALHARELGFVHPRTKEKMMFEAPVPADMEQVIERWRRYIGGKEE